METTEGETEAGGQREAALTRWEKSPEASTATRALARVQLGKLRHRATAEAGDRDRGTGK